MATIALIAAISEIGDFGVITVAFVSDTNLDRFSVKFTPRNKPENRAAIQGGYKHSGLLYYMSCYQMGTPNFFSPKIIFRLKNNMVYQKIIIDAYKIASTQQIHLGDIFLNTLYISYNNARHHSKINIH